MKQIVFVTTPASKPATRPQTQRKPVRRTRPATAVKPAPQPDPQLTEEEKELIGFHEWGHEYGFSRQQPFKFKASYMPRPASAATLPKPSLEAPKPIISIEPLYSLRYKAFKQSSFSNRDLLALQKQHQAQPYSEFPLKYSKPAVVLKKQVVRRPVSKDDSWENTVKSIMTAPPPKPASPSRPQNSISLVPKLKEPEEPEGPPVVSRPHKIIVTSYRFRRKQPAKEEPQWQPVIEVPLHFQQVRGKVIKESGSLGVMFRPEAQDPAIEQRLAPQVKEMSASVLKRIARLKG